ncbi:MAG: DUF4298 domain-containing protein [Lachnospiraceae bacterium]|nr:DUF4298 domain-containing protein [Lachnospiraceae bacterium]
MEQIERIQKYEKIMREAEELLHQSPVEHVDLLRQKIEELEAYYSGEDWKKDFADDEAGLLPQDLERGVLSEDGIFNLLERYKETLEDDVTQND